MAALGRYDDVRLALPDLLAAYPDDPGVMLLHGIVVDDPNKAIEIYEKIVKKFPDSPWADDAYWRIVQFYSLSHDTSRAAKELESFRKKYPYSEYLIVATDIYNTSSKIARKNSETEDISSIENEDEKIVAPAKKTTVKKDSEDTKKQSDSKKTSDEQKKQNDTKKNNQSSYGLQVGLFSTIEAAKSELAKYSKQRIMAEIKEKTVEGQKMFAVVIGNYSTKESAEEARDKVKSKCKCEPLLFKK